MRYRSPICRDYFSNQAEPPAVSAMKFVSMKRVLINASAAGGHGMPLALELSWLTNQQLAELLVSIRSGCDNPHVELVAMICRRPERGGPRPRS